MLLCSLWTVSQATGQILNEKEIYTDMTTIIFLEMYWNIWKVFQQKKWFLENMSLGTASILQRAMIITIFRETKLFESTGDRPVNSQWVLITFPIRASIQWKWTIDMKDTHAQNLIDVCLTYFMHLVFF